LFILNIGQYKAKLYLNSRTVGSFTSKNPRVIKDFIRPTSKSKIFQLTKGWW